MLYGRPNYGLSLRPSHYIRGKARDKATPEQMKANCLRAIEVGEHLRNAIPELSLYIPAEHEAFVQRAYDKHFLTEKQILEIDCDIIAGCDLVLFFAPDDLYLSYGMIVECDFAADAGIEQFIFKSLDVHEIHEVMKLVNKLKGEQK